MQWLCPQCRTRYPADDGACPDDGTPLVADRTGESVGGCVLEALIGVGRDRSTVWEAARGDEPRVAVKILPVDDDEEREALQAAARNAATLRHPHLVSIHGHGSTPDGHVYVVMELLEGLSLAELLARGEPTPPAQASRIVEQVLDGLSHAHREGVSHLDLKPADVFVGEDAGHPAVRVLDVGLGRPEPPDPPTALGLDRPIDDAVPEGLYYSAPELLVTGRGDARSDQYAVGALFFHLLTGRPPFPGKRADVKRGHLSRRPPRIAELLPGFGEADAVQTVIDRLMAKRPEQRYAGAAEARLAVGGLFAPPPPAVEDDEGYLDEMEDSFQNLRQVPEDQAAAPVVPPPLADPPSRPEVSSYFAPPPPPPPPPAPAGAPRWPLVVAIVALIGVGAWLLLQPDHPLSPVKPDSGATVAVVPDAAPPPPPPAPDAAPPPPDAAPPPPDAALPPDAAPQPQFNTVTSTPPGAIVRLPGGKALGPTPWSGILPPDTRALELELDGHEPARIELSAEEARRGGWKREVALERSAPTTTAAQRAAAARRRAAEAAAAEEARLAAEEAARRLAEEKAAAEKAAAERAAAEKAAAEKAARDKIAREKAAVGLLPVGRKDGDGKAGDGKAGGDKPRGPSGIDTLGEQTGAGGGKAGGDRPAIPTLSD